MLAALIIPATVFAQDATAQPAGAQQTPAAAEVTPGTPAPTLTPAPTPTATPTFTALQNQLVLAQTYLDGKDFARAAALFAAVAEVDRGNACGIGRAEGCAGRPGRCSRADSGAHLAVRTDRCAAARRGDGSEFGVEQADQLRQHGGGRAFCRGVGLSAGKCSPLAALWGARVVADAHSALAPPSRSPAGLFDRRVRQRVGRSTVAICRAL